jgi:outer membrane biosynthesis protein TonB
MLAVGMGLAIVLVSFLLFKVVRGRKVPVPPAATEVAKAAPEPAPAEPVAVVEPMPAPSPPAPAKPKEPPPAREAPAARAKAVPVAKTTPEPVVEKRRRASHRTKKGRHERAPRARKVAMAKPAKASAPAAPVEHADPRPAYERGNASLLAGDGKAAIAAYREAVKTSPSDPIGFRGLGLAYEQEGETALAIKALRRYLKLAPEADDRAIISRRLDRLAHRAKKK